MPRYINYKGKVIDEYNVTPYDRIIIVEEDFTYYYLVNPLRLSEKELEQLKNILDELAYILKPSELLGSGLEEKLRDLGGDDKLVTEVNRRIRGYDWLDPLIRDEKLEDIHCFKPNTQIRVVHRDYGLMKTNIVPSREEVDKMVRLLAYRSGSYISFFKPVKDTVILPEGDRAALTYRSEVSEASSFTIRKFPRDPWTPTKMIRTGMLSPDMMALLWLAMDAKIPIIVYGPMRTGKTSLLNSLVMLASPDSAICIVQDSPEMKVFHENILYLYTSDRIRFEELAKLALRKSVDYLVVNEVRVREEAYWWAQLVGTGHGGATSIHADSLERVFGRLKDLGVEESLADVVKIAVNTGLFINSRESDKVRIRRVNKIEFIDGLQDYIPVSDIVFSYDKSSDSHKTNSKILAKVFSLFEDTLPINVDDEFYMRSRFLDLASRFGVVSSEGFWKLYVRYRYSPKSVIGQLEKGVRRFRLENTDRSFNNVIRYCPHCGLELRPGTVKCPRCGFELVKIDA